MISLSTLRRSFQVTFQSGTLFFFFFLHGRLSVRNLIFCGSKKISPFRSQVIVWEYRIWRTTDQCSLKTLCDHSTSYILLWSVHIHVYFHDLARPLFETETHWKVAASALWNLQQQICNSHRCTHAQRRFPVPPPTPPSMLSLLGEWIHTGQKQSCNLKSHKYWLSITDLIPLYHADILHTATMFNPILLNRLEAIRSERITAAALCETETRLNHILCWSDTRLEWAEGSRRGQPFSEAETCKCTDSRDKSTNTEKTITERWEKKRSWMEKDGN